MRPRGARSQAGSAHRLPARPFQREHVREFAYSVLLLFCCVFVLGVECLGKDGVELSAWETDPHPLSFCATLACSKKEMIVSPRVAVSFVVCVAGFVAK